MPPKVPKLKAEESTNVETIWRSRFPVARIKKIMQADEDVGKVAQVVPVIISKSVELFMASMVQEASMRASETGHKRIIPGHLKMAVKGNAMFDFLEPLVEKVADPVNVGARPTEEKKIRRSRAKRPTEEGDQYSPHEHVHHDHASVQQDYPQHQRSPEIEVKTIRNDDGQSIPAAVDENQHQHKKVKSEDSTDRKSASRTMSIANMMSNDDD